MGFDASIMLDSIKEGTREIAETAHEKVGKFHENYVSEVLPDFGKYGDAAKFAAEMVPGVSEYNAIKEGDWQAFAIAAGIDIAAIGIGVFTAGAGLFALKSGTEAAKLSVKVATKEVAEAGTKKIAKEVVETGTKKVAKETAEAGAEKIAKEAVESGAEKMAKEAAETGAEKVAKAGTEKATKEVVEASTEKAVKEISEAQIVINKMEGIAREEKVLEKLVSKFGDDKVLREVLLRDASGTPIKDIITNEARRLDFVVIDGNKVLQSIEVTSETAEKGAQIAKELRILEQAKDIGGAFIKNPNNGELMPFGDIVTEIWRLM